jgi:hypothetical protein
MLAARCGYIALELMLKPNVAAQQKGPSNFDEPGNHKRRTQQCLPKTQRRQGCEGHSP